MAACSSSIGAGARQAVNSLRDSGLGARLPDMCKRAACTRIEPRRAVSAASVGAYGVVGLSGVKDARKSVLIADASSVGQLTGAGVTVHWTNTGQRLDKDWTFTGHPGCSRTALRLQRGCT